MIELDIEKDDCENAAEFIESEFFNHIYLELQSGELDNVGYIRSLIRAMDALYKAAGKVPLGISYVPEMDTGTDSRRIPNAYDYQH